MSQRTRNRTTAAAARKRPRATGQTSTSPSVTASPNSVAARPASPPPGADDPTVSPDTLARTLRAVAAELERDPALARRVAAAMSTDQATPTLSIGPRGTSSGRSDPPSAPEAARPAKRRAARVFTPSIIPGVSPDLGPGIPDPFALAHRLGPEGLRAALSDLRRGTLRAMIREHGIAPAAQVARITDDAKLREMILAAVLK